VNLPIDTSVVKFVAMGRPQLVTDFKTKQPRADADGQLLYAVQIGVLEDESNAELITVRVAGEPKGLAQGVAVKITGLVANPWARNDRSGIAYYADSIAPLATPARASS